MRKLVWAFSAALLGLLPPASTRADTPLAITVGDSLVRDYPDYPCCIFADGRWAGTIAAHPQFILIMLGVRPTSPRSNQTPAPALSPSWAYALVALLGCAVLAAGRARSR